MSVVPQTTVDEISRRLNVAEVMGRYVQLRRSGSKYVALCPFHNEKTPSMHVDPDKGLWYCFGCKTGGSVFQFVMRMEAMGFIEAVQKLGREVGIEVELSASNESNTLRKQGLALLERTIDYYQRLLLTTMTGAPGRDYLQKRGISREIAERFRLGYAPDSGTALLNELQKAGFSAELACSCGVATNHDYGARDLLRGRLVFPISDAQGTVLAVGGRAIGNDNPKYLNSPETGLYSKRRNLFGLNQARSTISKIDRAILVEGYFDVVSMHQAGACDTVASLGTALGPEQAELLHRYTRNVVLAYDGDSAGQHATLRGSELLEREGLRVSVAPLPEGEDPDTMATKLPGGVEEWIGKATGIVNFQIGLALNKIDITSPEGKEDFIREVLPSVERIGDPARQDAYVRKLAYYTGISETKLHWRLGRKIIPRIGIQSGRALDVEERLLCLCATEPQWIPLVRATVSLEMVMDKGLKPLFAALFAMEDRSEPVALSELAPFLEQAELMTRLAEILCQESLPSTEGDVCKLTEAVRDRGLRGRLDVLRKEVLPAIDAGSISPDDPLCQEYYALRRHFHGPGSR